MPGMTYCPIGHARRVVIALTVFVGLLAIRVSSGEPGSSSVETSRLDVLVPTSRIVYQRDNANHASIPIQGVCARNVEVVEARLVPRQNGQGKPTGWTRVPVQPNAGRYSGFLEVEGGWYDLELRAFISGAEVSHTEVNRIGVGEVFVIVGHSVAAGQDVNIPGAIDDRVSTVALDKATVAYQTYLSTGNPNFLPPPTFAHYGTGVIPAPFGSGNYFWSRFGEELVRKLNVPVLLYNAAFGGTSLEHWAKSAQGILFTHSFVKSSIRMPYINLANTLQKYIPSTGLRAILADQGQNDWTEKDETIIFKNYATWVAQARADLEFPRLAVVVNLQTPFRRDAAVRAAQERMAHTPDCFAGPDYDQLAPEDRADGIHLELSGQTNAAHLWAEALDTRFFVESVAWRPDFARAVQITTERTTPKPAQLRPAAVGAVEIADSFWAPKIRTYREKTIPHSWQYMQWELRALHKAAGETVTGDLNGTWGEANLYKFLETAAYALAMQRDADLEKKIDAIIDLLALAQRPDGYAHYFVTNSKKLPWDPAFLDGSHDGYVLGHLIEAAIEYSAATGKTKFLEIARRAADEAYDHFLGPNGQPGFCGHAELEMALVELHRVTGEARYLQLSKAFVEWRGRGKVKPVSETPRSYFQDEVPLRQQWTLEGHAVRALFFATGVADLALETGDADYRMAAHRFWESTARRRLAITGAVGPRHEHEAFGEDYELPNDGYYESCAACGLADFAQRMFLLERTSESIDVLERVLYNAVLHGMELTGTNSYYQNPLSDHDRPRYNSWVCCPPNLSRTLLQIGRYAYAQSDRDLFVNLFVGGTWHARVGSDGVDIRVTTEYPWDGRVQIALTLPKAAHFTVWLRRPGWAKQAELSLNGERVTTLPQAENGYWRLERTWQPNDRLDIQLEMPVERMVAHPNIRDCQGKVALQRGPLVYGFESLDNNGSAQVALGRQPNFTIESRPDWLGGVTVIHGTTADAKSFDAIPFYALANRGKAAQEVWATQCYVGLGDSWWLGRLYRPLEEVIAKEK